MASIVQWIRSKRKTHFTEAIALNGAELESLDCQQKNLRISNIYLIAKEQLAWEVWFFGDANGVNDADADRDSYVGHVDLNLLVNGVRIGATGYYHLNITLEEPILYIDEGKAREPKLHVALVCRTAAGKSAGVAGEVVLAIGAEEII